MPLSSVDSARRALERALAGVPLRGSERSIKLSPGRICADRALIGIEKQNLPRARLFSITHALRIPRDYWSAVDETYDRANFFYFGYEDERGAETLRVYAEYPVYIAPLTPQEESTDERSRPALYMVGYKWSASDGAAMATTQYVWYVHLARERIVHRIDVIAGGAAGAAFDLARNLVLRSQASAPAYIEATERGNARNSFDINVYDEGLTVGALAAPLETLAERYQLDHSAFDPVMSKIADRPLGHLSAGRDRRGAEFLTIYYET